MAYTAKRPPKGTYGAFYARYIEQASQPDHLLELEISGSEWMRVFRTIPEGKADYAYAEGKWSIRQLLQHLMDSEVVFSYRALCLSRYASYNLPGFDENAFADVKLGERRSLSTLLDTYERMRRNTVDIYRSMSDDQLDYVGQADQKDISARALGFIIAGHTWHHLNILKERYL